MLVKSLRVSAYFNIHCPAMFVCVQFLSHSGLALLISTLFFAYLMAFNMGKVKVPLCLIKYHTTLRAYGSVVV
jgi:hypothetical protein